jgi:hypothetical protein
LGDVENDEDLYSVQPLREALEEVPVEAMFTIMISPAATPVGLVMVNVVLTVVAVVALPRCAICPRTFPVMLPIKQKSMMLLTRKNLIPLSDEDRICLISLSILLSLYRLINCPRVQTENCHAFARRVAFPGVRVPNVCRIPAKNRIYELPIRRQGRRRSSGYRFIADRAGVKGPLIRYEVMYSYVLRQI